MLIKVKTVVTFGTTQTNTEYRNTWINLNQISLVTPTYSEYRQAGGGHTVSINLQYPDGQIPKLHVGSINIILDMPYEKFDEWYESVKVVSPSNLRVARGGNV